MANVLLVAQSRHRITPAQRDRFLQLLDRLALGVESTPPDSGALVWLGERYGLSAYDAWYLWLATRAGATLATVDDRLADSARATESPSSLSSGVDSRSGATT